MKATYSVPLQVQSELVNLEEWVFNLSDEDYQAASRAHRGAGQTVSNGVRGSVNVESIGGTLIVQHYREVSADRQHFELYSANSRGYMFHLIPVRIKVRWKMWVEARNARASMLHVAIESNMSPFLDLLSWTVGAPWMIQRHCKEETFGFARDIERKYAEQRDPVRG